MLITERLNDLLEQEMDTDKFTTLFLGGLNYQKHEVSYVNAGHDQPLCLRGETGGVVELDSTGTPLGMFPGCPYETGERRVLARGDFLVLSTDGI